MGDEYAVYDDPGVEYDVDPAAFDVCEPASTSFRDPKVYLQEKDDKRKAFWLRKRKKQRERDVSPSTLLPHLSLHH